MTSKEAHGGKPECEQNCLRYWHDGQRSYVANDTFVVCPLPSSRMYITPIVLPSGDNTFVSTCVTLPSFLLMISVIRSLIRRTAA